MMAFIRNSRRDGLSVKMLRKFISYLFASSEMKRNRNDDR